jgi:Domain of unknown function(DUF2779)
MSTSTYSISKTSFLKFEQCQKAFFLYKNHPYLRDKLSIDKQLTFKRGHDVGYFAQQIFPGGIDVSTETKNSAAAIELTATLIQNKTPVIYEATFVFNGVLIMVDILCLHDGKYLAYEVKSSIKISEIYTKDACLQYYVLKNALPDFDDLFLVTLNADYVLKNHIDPKKLFKKRSFKLKAEENILFFNHRLTQAHEVLEQNTIPNVAIGKHCFRPYQCDYFGTCWKDAVNETSIFNLPFIDKDKLFEWYYAGKKNIEQIENELLEKDVLIKIKQAFLTNEPIVDVEKIKNVLAKITLPMAAMDMEIWSPAIPQLEGTKPFEQVPFLVCIYDGINNFNFFTELLVDNRNVFAQKLVTLSSTYATILVYDKTMEVAAINALIKNYPEFNEGLETLKNKLVDVFDIFLNLSYYHPNFKNNFSLKVVSQSLLNDINYSKISSGLEAMNYFEQYRLAEDETQKEQIKTDLISYCKTDTLATYKLVAFLKQLVS